MLFAAQAFFRIRAITTDTNTQTHKHTIMSTESSNSEEAIFVDENRNIFKGQEAIQRINSRKNEEVDPQKGIIKVDQERWKEAQRYERRTWMEGVAAMSDRNEEHESCFGAYRALAGKHFGSAIELGCGPFTNMRKILSHCSVENIHLLDPLATDYLDHPFCRYKMRRLGGILKTTLIPWTPRGGLKHPVRFYKHKLDEWQIGKLQGRSVTLHASGIEDFVPSQTFDLCVMINVIEHCRDVEKIFERILEMTRSGSYFLFADKIYGAQSEAELSKTRFDAGHPLRVDYSVIRMFLQDHFNPLWNAEVSETEGSQTYQCSYFIGTRK